MRVVEPGRAKVFQSRDNHLGRLTWTLVAHLNLETGTVELVPGVNPKDGLEAWCSEARNMLASAPGNYSELLTGIGRYGEALASMDAKLKIDGFEVLLLAMEDLKEAMISSTGRALITERDHEFHIDLGQHLMGEGIYDRAVEVFGTALQQAQNGGALPRVIANIHVFLAQAERARGETGTAVRHMEKALEVSPTPVPGMVLRLIDYALVTGEKETAEAWLRRFDEDGFEATSEQRLTASRFAARGEMGVLSVAIAERLVAGAEGDVAPGVLLHLVNNARRFDGEERAIAMVETHVPEDVADPALRIWQVRAALFRKNHGRARERAEALISDHDGNGEGWMLAGHAAAQDGDHAAAVPALEKAAEIRPDHALTQRFLAQARAQTGDRDGAIAAAERALELNGGDGIARALLERLQGAE